MGRLGYGASEPETLLGGGGGGGGGGGDCVVVLGPPTTRPRRTGRQCALARAVGTGCGPSTEELAWTEDLVASGTQKQGCPHANALGEGDRVLPSRPGPQQKQKFSHHHSLERGPCFLSLKHGRRCWRSRRRGGGPLGPAGLARAPAGLGLAWQARERG